MPIEWHPFGWHIIGYEEYRLGHNYLLEHGLAHLVSEYHAAFNALALRHRWIAPNTWHFAACNECYEYWFYLPVEQKAQPLQDYLSSPVIEGYRPDLQGWNLSKSDLCDWCGRQFQHGCHVMDWLQEHVFCCPEHALAHRRRTAELIPEVHETYRNYQFKPLPVDPNKMLSYFNQLPSIRQGLAEGNIALKPVVLPEVRRGKIVRVSNKELSSGNQTNPAQEQIKGLTYEDD
jgi:hypothetical protein